MEILRPNKQRAKNAITLIYLVLAFGVVSIISSYVQYELIEVAKTSGISSETADANDLRERIIAICRLIVYLISGVTFIQWFRRAYYNLHLRAEELSYTEGWAAGSWFVPFINLARPYKIMKELYHETHVLIEKKGLKIPVNFSVNHIGWWWALWIVNNFYGQFLYRLTNDAKTIDQIANATIGSIIGEIIGIPLALITIKLIKDYSILERQLAKIDHIQDAVVIEEDALSITTVES